jgi:hypothetical protein
VALHRTVSQNGWWRSQSSALVGTSWDLVRRIATHSLGRRASAACSNTRVRQPTGGVRRWRSLKVLDVVLGLDESVEPAINGGKISRREAAQWIQYQRAREVDGAFFATVPKIQVVPRNVECSPP